jgi:hypothetical protein
MRPRFALSLLPLLFTACEATAYTRVPAESSKVATPRPAEIPTLAEPVAAPKAPTDAPPVDRSIIYNATLALTVVDIRSTQTSIQQYANANGGYLQEIAGSSITIRVPAAKFEAAISTIEHFGELTDRHIEANDVTEELHDLHIRLENAMHVRDRLTALLEKATKMEDTIAIEKQLEEVTEQIERLKGKIQFTENRVALSTITVNLNSPRPQNDTTATLPFQWVRELASGAVSGDTEPQPDTNRLWKRNDRFQLPAGFVRYYERCRRMTP